MLFFLPFVLFTFAGCAGGLSRKEASNLYFNLGNAYFELGQNDKAVQAYLRALSFNRRMRVASFNLAKAYIELGRFSDSLNVLNRMLREDPNNIILLSAKAYCLYRSGEFEESAEIYSRILGIDPGNIEALFNSAVIKAKKESFEEALEKLAILKTRRIDNERLRRRINAQIGAIFYKAGEYSQAIEYLEYTRGNEFNSLENLKMLFNSYVQIRAFSSAIDIGKQIVDKEKDKDILFQLAFIYLTAVEEIRTGISFLNQAIAAGFSDREKASRLMENLPRGMIRSVSEILTRENLLDS
ncbi:MAG: tetratricopeptide repeat protein [Spirochaetes bacterium]|nr:tetratricopeptide repeat protein [Spirochaetota bacterium]